MPDGQKKRDWFLPPISQWTDWGGAWDAWKRQVGSLGAQAPQPRTFLETMATISPPTALWADINRMTKTPSAGQAWEAGWSPSGGRGVGAISPTGARKGVFPPGSSQWGIQQAEEATEKQGRDIAMENLLGQAMRLQQQVPFARYRDVQIMDFEDLIPYVQYLQDLLQQSQAEQQASTQVPVEQPTAWRDILGAPPTASLEEIRRGKSQLEAVGDRETPFLGEGGFGSEQGIRTMQTISQRQIAQAKDFREIIGELKELNPELAQSFLDKMKSSRSRELGAEREPIQGYSVSRDDQMAVWAADLPEFEQARREVETQRWTEFGDIYGGYLDYKEALGFQAKPFQTWMDESPFIQSLLQQKGVAEQERTRGIERGVRPPRRAVARQR